MHLKKVETDEALLVHVCLAIEEINDIVRGFLQPNSSEMSKTLYVLDAPPDDPF